MQWIWIGFLIGIGLALAGAFILLLFRAWRILLSVLYWLTIAALSTFILYFASKGNETAQGVVGIFLVVGFAFFYSHHLRKKETLERLISGSATPPQRIPPGFFSLTPRYKFLMAIGVCMVLVLAIQLPSYLPASGLEVAAVVALVGLLTIAIMHVKWASKPANEEQINFIKKQIKTISATAAPGQEHGSPSIYQLSALKQMKKGEAQRAIRTLNKNIHEAFKEGLISDFSG